LSNSGRQRLAEHFSELFGLRPLRRQLLNKSIVQFLLLERQRRLRDHSRLVVTRRIVKLLGDQRLLRGLVSAGGRHGFGLFLHLLLSDFFAEALLDDLLLLFLAFELLLHFDTLLLLLLAESFLLLLQLTLLVLDFAQLLLVLLDFLGLANEIVGAWLGLLDRLLLLLFFLFLL
jgi:hypothetical protein